MVERDPKYGARRMAENAARHRSKMASDPQYAERTREDARMRARIARAQDPRLVQKEREYARKRRELDCSLNERAAKSLHDARQKDVVKFLIRGAKSRSIKRGHDFDLTIEWARLRWTGKCELTGIAFDWSKPIMHAMSPSLDRIDSIRGYTRDNCRFILQSVNAFKGTATDDEMLSIARALVRGGNLD